MQKQVREIIQTVQQYHSNLSLEYQSLKDEAYDQRAILLLNYLSGREKKIAGSLERYLHDSSSKALNTWVKCVPCLPVDVFSYCHNKLNFEPPLYADDILEIAIHYDDCLVGFFNNLVRESDYSATENLFSMLLNNAKKEEMNLARDVLWLNDI